MMGWIPLICRILILSCTWHCIAENNNIYETSSYSNGSIKQESFENVLLLYNINLHELSSSKIKRQIIPRNNKMKNISNYEDLNYEISEKNASNSSSTVNNKKSNEKYNPFALNFADLSEATPLDEMEEIENTITEMDNATTILPNVTTIDNVTDFADVGAEDVTEVMNLTTVSSINNSVSSTTAPPKKKKTKTKKKMAAPPKDTICYCDLTKSSCDVNCCCDLDCTEADKTIFIECIEDEAGSSNLNLQYCSTKQLLYKNNSPWLVEKKTNDLFCIYKDNLPPKLKKNPYKAITLYDDLAEIIKSHYSWRNPLTTEEIFFDSTKLYKYNDYIWILKNSTLQTFDIPSSDINNYCSSRVPLRYLINHKTKCVGEIFNLELLNVYNTNSEMFLISSPTAFNETWLINTHECPANVCIPIQAIVCNPYNTCKLLNSTDRDLQPLCEDGNCKTITSMRYIFHSNGSEGFTNATVYFGITDIALNYKHIELSFEVTHVWIKKNITDDPKVLSGNSGYINGKPILSSRFISYKDNTSSDPISILDYFFTTNISYMQNILYFPQNVYGECVVTNTTHGIISFRNNVRTSCRMIYNISNYILNKNATEACRDIRKKLISQIAYGKFLENQTKIWISSIGNPTPEAKDWVELIYVAPESVIGEFGDNETCLTCKNLIRWVKYEFAYASIDQVNSKSQMTIIGAGLRYVTEIVNFDIADGTVSTVFTVSSMFYDVTKPQKSEYAKGPNFHINLPNDFFYPFTLNTCTVLKSCSISVMFNALLLLRINYNGLFFY